MSWTPDLTRTPAWTSYPSCRKPYKFAWFGAMSAPLPCIWGPERRIGPMRPFKLCRKPVEIVELDPGTRRRPLGVAPSLLRSLAGLPPARATGELTEKSCGVYGRWCIQKPCVFACFTYTPALLWKSNCGWCIWKPCVLCVLHIHQRRSVICFFAVAQGVTHRLMAVPQ